MGSRSEARFRAKPTSTAGSMNTIAVRTSVRRKKYLSARERRAADAPVTSSLSNPRAASVASDWVSKMAGRRFSLIQVDPYEDVSAPREISNRAADEFQEIRDEIVEERAARFLPHPDRGGHDGS